MSVYHIINKKRIDTPRLTKINKIPIPECRRCNSLSSLVENLKSQLKNLQEQLLLLSSYKAIDDEPFDSDIIDNLKNKLISLKEEEVIETEFIEETPDHQSRIKELTDKTNIIRDKQFVPPSPRRVASNSHLSSVPPPSIRRINSQAVSRRAAVTPPPIPTKTTTHAFLKRK